MELFYFYFLSCQVEVGLSIKNSIQEKRLVHSRQKKHENYCVYSLLQAPQLFHIQEHLCLPIIWCWHHRDITVFCEWKNRWNAALTDLAFNIEEIKDNACTNFGVTKLLTYAQSDLKSITSFMSTPLTVSIHHCCHRGYVIHISFLFSQTFETACKMSFENWCYLSVPAVIPGQVTDFYKINKQTPH